MGEDGFAMGYALGQDSNGGNNGMFGGDGWWAIILFALIFGRGGYGGFGGGSGNDGVSAGFAWQGIDNGIRGIQQGICDSTYALNNSIMNGFHGVDNAVCTLGYQTQSGFNTLGAQLASCCCDIERGQDRIANQITNCCCDVERQIERGFCETNANIAAQTRGIIDYLTNEKIDSLRAENQTLRFQASQVAQNQFITQVGSDIVNRLQPVPVPSYTVPNPYAAYSYYGYGRGGDCGCGCN